MGVRRMSARVRRIARITAAGVAAAALSVGTAGVAVAVTPTAFGAVVKPKSGETYPQALASSESRYGRLGVIRYFDGNAPDDWSLYNSKFTDHTSIISFRIPPSTVNSGSADATLRTWFRNAPTTRTTYWTYMHEPEDEIPRSYSALAYRTAWQRVADIAAANAPDTMVATFILQCYTVNPASHRTWTDYYPGAQYVDVLGWDCYNHGEKRGVYGEPATLYSRAIDVSRQAGKPWGMAEIGSKLATGDTTGSGRAAWLRKAAVYLHNEGAQFVSYFDTNGAGTDYRLLDEPSRQAWYDVVSDQTP